MYPYEYADDYDPRYDPRYTRPPRIHSHSYRRSGHNQLSPDAHYGGGGGGGSIERSRSHGHGPRPEVINIYNDNVVDVNQYADALPPSPDLRGRPGLALADQMLADDMAAMRLAARSRSRGRGYSDAMMLGALPPPQAYYDPYAGGRQSLEDRLKTEYELKRAQEEVKRKLDEEAAAAREKAIVANYEAKQAAKAQEAKDAEKALRARLEREEQEKKAKEKAEWDEFLLKQKLKKEEEERKEKAKEEELEREMKERLLSHGYTMAEVERMISKKKKEEHGHTTTALVLSGGGGGGGLSLRTPVYGKVHRDYLDIDTLRHFGIPYEYDRDDHNYIIILQEMSKRETQVLFEHTRQLRGRQLLIEDNHKKKKGPEYAFVRHRDRGRSKSRDNVRKVGVLEIRR